jgi:hypothetical protein
MRKQNHAGACRRKAGGREAGEDAWMIWAWAEKASEEARIKVDKEVERLRMKDIEGVKVGSLIRR